MNNKTLLGIAVGIVFLIGAGYIVYMGRPVMNMADPEPLSLLQQPKSLLRAR